MKPEKILFETEMTASGGRYGSAVSPDGSFTLGLVIPKALGGPGGDGTNPEQLFAAGYSACFLSALKLVGRTTKNPVPDETSVTAKVGMGAVEIGYGLTVELTVNIPGMDAATAQTLVDGAHQRCPYSRAIRGNVDVEIRLT